MNTESPPTPDPLGVVRLTQRGFRIVKDQARRMATFFVVAMTIVVIGLTVCPRKYISESRLFVRVGRENIGLDTTATTGQTISLAESRENEITSILDILESQTVLTGPGTVLPASQWSRWQTVPDVPISVHGRGCRRPQGRSAQGERTGWTGIQDGA